MADYISALSFLGDPIYWVMLLLALALVATLGLVPGVGGTTVAAIALSFLIFNVESPTAAIVFLAAMAGTNNTLDSLTAVLVGYPGAATQVTYLEGQQIARRGQAAYLMGAIYAVEGMGAVVGAIALLLALPLMKPLLANFSFPEIAAMAMWGVFMVSVLSRGAMKKGIIAGLLGILISTIGEDKYQGIPRFSFDQLYLTDGLPLIPVLIGIFALPELIDLTMSRRPIGLPGTVSTREVLRGAAYGMKKWPMTIRQSIFGVFAGAIPGIGSAVVDWLAYAFGIAFAKDKSEFGKGSIDGVLFAEAAQNSKEGGQAIPTLAFGIPGGSAWAIVVVGMLFYGVAPGLGILDQHLDTMLAVVVSLALGNVLLCLLGLVATGQLGKLTLLPYPLLAAALMPLVVLAAFMATRQWGDVLVLLGVASLGMAMKWMRWPRPPFILGFILGPIIERNLVTAVGIFGPWLVFRPISLVLLVLSVVSVVYLTKSIGRAGAIAESTLAGLDTGSGSATVRASDAPRAAPALAQGLASLTERLRNLRFVWRRETLFSVFLAVLVAIFFEESLGFKQVQVRFLPFYTSLAILVLLAAEILSQSLRTRSAEEGEGIMDLGMRTGTGKEAFKSLMVVSAWLGALVIGAAIIGLQYAAIAFAFLFAIVMLPWRGKSRLWALLPGILLTVVIFGVFNTIMNVLWPDPVIWNWITGGGP